MNEKEDITDLPLTVSTNDKRIDVPQSLPQSLFSQFIENENESEMDFLLVPPNKFQPGERNLCITINFYIGGKSSLAVITTDLSMKHLVRDVIKHVLTLLRKDRYIQS